MADKPIESSMREGEAVYPLNPESIGTGDLYTRVNVDCEDALKGLKAITREAKKATAALKELEEQQDKVNHIDLMIDGKTVAKSVLPHVQDEIERQSRVRGNFR